MERRAHLDGLLVDLGIAVVSYRSRELVLRCIASLEREVQDLSWCLAVWNNSPGDGTVEAIEALGSARIQVRDAPANLGFAAGCNAAVRALPLPCRTVLLLNPDTELRDGSLQELTAHLEAHAGVGIVGAQLFFEDGRPQPGIRRFPSPGNLLFSRRSPLSRLMPGNRRSRAYLYADRDPAQAGPVEVVAGAALAIRATLWQELGGMDERFFMYAEDSDLCYRAMQLGWQVHHVPAARVYHRWGASAAQHQWVTWVEHQRSIVQFMRKHGRVPGPLGRLMAGAVGCEAALLRLFRRRQR